MKTTEYDRSTPHGRFWAMVETARNEHPEWTNLMALTYVQNSAEGAALWSQLGDANKEFQAQIARQLHLPPASRSGGSAAEPTDMAKRERVEIRKQRDTDPNALTGKELADAKLLEIQKRFVADGLRPDAAWYATLQSKEGKEWARIRDSKYAHLTTAESAARTLDDVDTLKADIAKALRGEPTTLHDAVVALQKSEGLDYPSALQRAIADPRNADLVKRYNNEGR